MTIFRVRLDGLKPQTTYYYVVTAIDSSGKSDRVRSPLNQLPSRPGESHPEPLTDPYVNLSIHTARATL
jgi:hypothetical protein